MTASRQTKLKLRKGFTAAPMHYRVLMNHQFNDVDKKTIAKGLIVATTPKQAEKLLPTAKDKLLPRDKRSKWSMFSSSSIGLSGTFDIQILRFKGLDVAVYFKRQTSVVTPEPEDPAPEGYIENDDDIWARLDLFSKSPRQLVGSVKEELSGKDATIQQLESEIATQRSLLETQASTITSLRSQIANASSKTKKRK